MMILLVLISVFVQVYFVYESYTNINTKGMQIIDQTKSKYQTIDLVRDKKTNNVCMFLNGVIQNHSKEYKRSHYAMVDISVKLLNSYPKNILILGGGDGFPAMRALTYNNVHVKNVEIDDTLIDFVKTNPIMKKNTRNAFNNPKLELKAMDAYNYIYQEKNKFDIIVHDIELNTNNSVTEFGSHDDYVLENLLSDKGVLNYTQDLTDDIPEFKGVYKQYMKLKNKSPKKHFMLLLQTKEEFDFLNGIGLFDVKKLKSKHPKSEIGIIMYDLEYFCGTYEYGEELYFYLSKQPFNKSNNDIEFYPFIDVITSL